MRYERFASSLTLSCVVLAFSLAACTSTTNEEGGIASVEAKLTLTFPPAGADKKVEKICGEIWCTGIDPILGVPRPSQDFPEKYCVDVSTTEGEDGFGLLAKRGLSAPGDCTIYAQGTTTDGTTTCEDTVTFPVKVNDVADITVFLNCITDPLYGGVDAAATTNSCPVYRQILLTPTTQSIGSDFTVRTEVYDAEDQDANVRVESDCGPVNDSLQQRMSCEDKDGALCDAAQTTVECSDAKACTITVTVEAIDPRELEGCNGEMPDGTNNDAARQTIDVICQQALACGDGNIVAPETCDPPSVPPNAANSQTPPVWCSAGCQEVDPCNPVDRFCPTVAEAGLDDVCVNAVTCDVATPVAEGDTPNCGFDFVAAGTICGAGAECDGAGLCVVGQVCPVGDPSGCNVVACQAATCPAGVCVYAPDSTQDGVSCDSGTGSRDGSCNGTTGNCDSNDACTASDTSACGTTNECFDAVCDTTQTPYACSETYDGTNACTTCANTPDCVCDDATETCENAPADCGDHLCTFTPAGASQVNLQTALFPLTLPANGSANILCSGNSPDETTGTCGCTGEILNVDPIPITGIGTACLIPVDAEVCSPPNTPFEGNVACLGGADQDVDFVLDHNLYLTTGGGPCTTNGQCDTACTAACGAVGAANAAANCGGYCQLSGDACVNDADCTAVAGDTCTGPEPVDAAHQGECQCSCLTFGDTVPDEVGDARFFTGFGLNVLTACDEAQCGPDLTPCTADDAPAITIPPQCAPFTTTSASTAIVNANSTQDATIGIPTVTGTPFVCDADDNVPTGASGVGLRTAAAFPDSTLGDIAATVVFNCE